MTVSFMCSSALCSPKDLLSLQDVCKTIQEIREENMANLPINKLVYLVLCFLKGILEVVFGACDFLFCFLSGKELC